MSNLSLKFLPYFSCPHTSHPAVFDDPGSARGWCSPEVSYVLFSFFIVSSIFYHACRSCSLQRAVQKIRFTKDIQSEKKNRSTNPLSWFSKKLLRHSTKVPVSTSSIFLIFYYGSVDCQYEVDHQYGKLGTGCIPCVGSTRIMIALNPEQNHHQPIH